MLLDFIDQKLEERQKVKKRAMYYSLLGQGITSTEEVDRYLIDVCQLLETSRESLGVEASAKGLMAGGGLTSADMMEYI